MSGAQIQIEAGGTFTRDPEYTLFSRAYETRETYLAESLEIPFDRSKPEFGGTVSARLPPKGDIVRRITVRSTLPELYTPLGPGYVYPLYTDQVDGNVFVSTNTLAIAPGDFVGYFNTQYLNFWATNFTGYTMNVAYDSAVNKFVFASSTYSNIFFKNDSSGVFWGFDPRTFDFVTPAGYKGYQLTAGTLTAPLTLVQAGWIRGFTPPPPTGFSYKDSVACRLIKSATLSIGGQTIDRLTGERLIIEDDLSVPYENQAALTILEGKNDPAGVYAPREYYTRLTFNMDTLPVTQMYRNDVRVDLEYEKFANLPATPITTNSLTDGASYVNTQYKSVLGIPADARSLATLVYKNYIIYMIKNNTILIFWFYDTTKPIGLASSWTSWTDTAGANADRAYITDGSMYYNPGTNYLVRTSVDDMIKGTAVRTTGAPFFNNTYYGFTRGGITSDARYVYILLRVSMITIGSNSMSLSTTTPLSTLTSNITMNFTVYNIATPQLTPSDNTAFINEVTNLSPSYGGGITKTVNIISQVKLLSNIAVTANVQYSSAITSPNDTFSLTRRTTIWLRYDSTKPFNDTSSYDYLSYPGTGAPKPFYDIFQKYIGFNNEIYPTSDGRYIYATDSPYLWKVDTQNFLDQVSYTYFNVATLTYPPTFFGWVPNTTDGRNIYFAALKDASGLRIPWYDSTKSISAPVAYSNYLYTGLPASSINNGTFFLPNSFDGRSVYYTTGVQYSPNGILDPTSSVLSFMTILRFDTVTKTVTDWIIFDGTGKAVTSKGQTVPTIAFTSTGPVGAMIRPNPAYVTSVVGSRYVYISEIWAGGDVTFTDFVQFDPLVMTPALSSSLIIKYEKYEKPPVMPKMLYGQTDLNEFTMRSGRKQDQFQLRFQGPVREFWVTVDSPGVVTRIRLLFNGEVIVDDDQVTTRTIRAFENHTAMPSSSNVCTYSFAIEPEKLTPSGTINFSRIATPMLEVTLASAPVTDLTVRVYAKIFNVLTNQNGLGGLLFNSAL